MRTGNTYREKMQNKKNNEKNRKRKGFTIGTSLILVTFVLLALITFATISYVEARADYKLSKDSADRITEYYAANSLAEEKLARINDVLKNEAAAAFDYDEYVENVKNSLINEELEFANDNQGTYVLYYQSINENSSLFVKLLINEPGDQKVSSVYEWKVINKEQESQSQQVKLLF